MCKNNRDMNKRFLTAKKEETIQYSLHSTYCKSACEYFYWPRDICAKKKKEKEKTQTLESAKWLFQTKRSKPHLDVNLLITSAVRVTAE